MTNKRRDARYCGKRCRQASWRFSRVVGELRVSAESKRLAYADPPYPGKSHLYRGHPDYAGEVDIRAELSRLQGYDGWALSTSSGALVEVCAIAREVCGDRVRVASWHRGGRPGRTRFPVDAWEPVLYWPARRLPEDGRCDNELQLVARPRVTDPGRVVGAKPAAFCAWLFDLLAARAGDTLADLYPGSGGVSRAFRVAVGGGAAAGSRHVEDTPAGVAATPSRGAGAEPSRPGFDASPRSRRDASSPAVADVSLPGQRDASPRGQRDASPRSRRDGSAVRR